MFDFENPQNWQQIYSDTKVAANQTVNGRYEPIQDFTVFCDYSIIAVGSQNPYGLYNWQLGAWCYTTKPNSPSQELPNSLQFGRFAVPLNRMAVFELNNLTIAPYTLLC